jgi:hypothetical protein
MWFCMVLFCILTIMAPFAGKNPFLLAPRVLHTQVKLNIDAPKNSLFGLQNTIFWTVSFSWFKNWPSSQYTFHLCSNDISPSKSVLFLNFKYVDCWPWFEYQTNCVFFRLYYSTYKSNRYINTLYEYLIFEISLKCLLNQRY